MKKSRRTGPACSWVAHAKRARARVAWLDAVVFTPVAIFVAVFVWLARPEPVNPRYPAVKIESLWGQIDSKLRDIEAGVYHKDDPQVWGRIGWYLTQIQWWEARAQKLSENDS